MTHELVEMFLFSAMIVAAVYIIKNNSKNG